MRTVISRGRYKFPSGGKDTVWARREESGPDSAGALGPFASVQHVIKGEKVVTGLFLLKVAQSYPVLWSQEENLFLAARQLTTLNPSSQFPRRPLSFLPAFFFLLRSLRVAASATLVFTNLTLSLRGTVCSDCSRWRISSRSAALFVFTENWFGTKLGKRQP